MAAAKDYVETIKDTLSGAGKYFDVPSVTILLKVKNTMTDRAIPNTAVDRILVEESDSNFNKLRCEMILWIHSTKCVKRR